MLAATTHAYTGAIQLKPQQRGGHYARHFYSPIPVLGCFAGHQVEVQVHNDGVHAYQWVRLVVVAVGLGSHAPCALCSLYLLS